MTALSAQIALGIRAHQAAHAHLRRNLAECACRGVKLGCPDCANHTPQPPVVDDLVTSAPEREPLQAALYRPGRPVGQVLGVDGDRAFWKGACSSAWVPLADLQLLPVRWPAA